ncbi:dihydroxy-acid dehydratase [Ramlibacter sp. AW1]|uniref:Dihydroxy-acid dehydratase n=1 Tax=Ramlibacter aurantiacus TaxID=2801330 RepID=A0A936ZHP7_9BURK|nr:dihydroxy-acid dehydratase [Ramlibacter aurantiacus]MBL0421107.1 dihydroxy-acid dehydratase [Ramlibacter aurantiacus]
MTRPLRSNLQPGSTLWAGRRAQWRALGLNDEELTRPKIAVVNSSSKLSSCFSHLDEVAAEVSKAIREAGGVPFEIRTAASSDFITSAGCGGSYILPTRDLIANDIEVAVDGALLDGMVCLASCDKTTPGQLMAAARMNVPALIVSCGYQQTGEYKGESVDIEEVFLRAGYIASGGITVDELANLADNAVRSPGVCAGMGTANTMHIAAESLGMSLPGSAPVQALSDKMFDNARASGRRIVEMVWQDLKPRDVLTAGAFRNAAIAVLSVSGSINAVKHLQAVAVEAGLDIDLYTVFDECARTTPLLAAVRPNGHGTIAEFEQAGGALTLLKRLEPLLDREVLTVSGRRVGEVLAGVQPGAPGAIATLEQPLSRVPSLNIVRGSLLPGGGIVRIGGTEGRTMRFRGPAQLFHSRDEALAAIKAGQVRRGSVVVLRGLGVRGGPGMAMTSAVVFALDGAGLIDDVAVITEGQLSGLVNKGLVVGEASPEAGDGGPIGLINEGDEIEIDVERRIVDLHVPEETLQQRRAEKREFGVPVPRGWLTIYRDNVGPVHEGAVLRNSTR